MMKKTLESVCLSCVAVGVVILETAREEKKMKYLKDSLCRMGGRAREQEVTREAGRARRNQLSSFVSCKALMRGMHGREERRRKEDDDAEEEAVDQLSLLVNQSQRAAAALDIVQICRGGGGESAECGLGR